MISPKLWIESLQSKPYETKVKILWSSVAVIGILIFVIWMIDLKTTISGLQGTGLFGVDPAKDNANSVGTDYIRIEYIEEAEGGLKIFFNVTNPTNDILSFSNVNNITLSIEGTTIKPTGVTNRQGTAFVQKILSHTTNFGTLIFPAVEASKGTIKFDNLSFEQSPEQSMQQTIDIDFEKLNQSTEVRN